MQLILVWLLPLAGAALVLAVMNSDRSPAKSCGPDNGAAPDLRWGDIGGHTGNGGHDGHGGHSAGGGH